MKKLSICYLLLLLMLAACQGSQKTKLRGAQTIKGVVYGDSVFDNNVRDLETMYALLQKDTKTKLKLRAVVGQVCKKKGCWLTIKNATQEEIIVRFKDYGFFVPQNIEGKEVILDGEAKVEILSVEEQRHFAEDAGLSTAEINKITTIKKTVAFEAKGLVVL